MTRLTSVSLLALTALGAPAASALDFGNGFSLTGEVELEYLTTGNSDASFGWIDLTLGWRGDTGGAIGFGFDLGIDSTQFLDTGGDFTAYWGGLVVTTASGEFTIGAPRPVLDVLYSTPDVGGSSFFALQLQQFTGPLATTLVKQIGLDAYGVSFIGASGELDYGVYYGNVDDIGADIVQIAVTYQLGATLFQGGAEFVNTGTQDVQYVSIAVTQDFERFSLGAEISDFGGGAIDSVTIKVFGDYQVTDALVLGVQIQDIEANGLRLYGLSGEYGFGSVGYARLGVIDDNVGGTDPVFDAAIGFRF